MHTAEVHASSRASLSLVVIVTSYHSSFSSRMTYVIHLLQKSNKKIMLSNNAGHTICLI